MKKRYRELLISFVTFVAGLYFFLEWFLPKKLSEAFPEGFLSESVGNFEFGAWHDEISTGFILTGVTAIGLGLINLVRVHGGIIVKNRKGAMNSFALLLGAFAVFAIEGKDFLYSVEQSEEIQRLNQLDEYKEKYAGNFEKLSLLDTEVKRIKDLTRNPESLYYSDNKELGAKLDEVSSKIESRDFSFSFVEILSIARDIWEENKQSFFSVKASDFVFNAFFVPLGSAMFSLLAFYVATAAYRTFRINTLETTLMMVGAVLVILGQIPPGPMYIDEDLPRLRLWLMLFISTPASRAIAFGALIAGLAMSLRMWLSLEKSPLSVDKE